MIYKYEIITLSQRNYEIIANIEEMQFLNDKGKKLTTPKSYLFNYIISTNM